MRPWHSTWSTGPHHWSPGSHHTAWRTTVLALFIEELLLHLLPFHLCCQRSWSSTRAHGSTRAAHHSHHSWVHHARIHHSWVHHSITRTHHHATRTPGTSWPHHRAVWTHHRVPHWSHHAVWRIWTPGSTRSHHGTSSWAHWTTHRSAHGTHRSHWTIRTHSWSHRTHGPPRTHWATMASHTFVWE